MERLSKIVFVLILLLCFVSLADADITITPASPDVSNCYPFGGTDNEPGWPPYAGFVYQNVPAFDLQPGDIIAFDLGDQNDTDIQLEIAMAPAIGNGALNESGSFTTIVSNTQIPQNPRGDNIIGNYELRFTVEHPFSFPGGGLLIRFSNPGGAYATDTICDQVLVNADSTDSSGYFVARFFNDADGVSPWDEGGTSDIGGFRIINQTSSIPTMNEWGMIIFVVFAGLGAVYYLRRQTRANS
jgi:hypothetical protein